MASVTEDGYPYPESLDMLAEGAEAIQELAESIEIYRGTTEPAHKAGRIWLRPVS